MSTHNLGLHGVLKQVVYSLSSNTQLRCLLSTVTHGDNVFGTKRQMSGGDKNTCSMPIILNCIIWAMGAIFQRSLRPLQAENKLE